MSDTGPDYELLLSALPEREREALIDMAAALGFEVEELGACPPLRVLVPMLAVIRLATAMDTLGRAASFEEAAARLGLRGDSLLRTWYRWQANAARQFVIDDEGVA